MIRKKPPEKKFITKYTSCKASEQKCPNCKGTGEVEKETGGATACPQCGGGGFVAYIWEIHIAA